MSIRVMSLIWDAYPGGGGSELLALLALADWSDDEGRCWPAVAAIAEKARLSRSQAQRVVHGLIGSGFVLVEGNEYGGKPGATRQYRINLKAMTGRTGATGSVRATGSADAQEGSHGCAKRGRTGATQTISEPSVHVKVIADEPLVSSKAAGPCPHQDIINLYHQALPSGRQVKVWNNTREAKLRARWKEEAKRQNLDWWSKFFGYIAESDFLTGKTSSPGRKPFELDLEWIVTPANFVKIVEGKYHEADRAPSQAAMPAMFKGVL